MPAQVQVLPLTLLFFFCPLSFPAVCPLPFLEFRCPLRGRSHVPPSQRGEDRALAETAGLGCNHARDNTTFSASFFAWPPFSRIFFEWFCNSPKKAPWYSFLSTCQGASSALRHRCPCSQRPARWRMGGASTCLGVQQSSRSGGAQCCNGLSPEHS